MIINEGSSFGICPNNEDEDNDDDEDKYNKDNIFLYGFIV